MDAVTNLNENAKVAVFETLKNYTAEDVTCLFKSKRVLVAYGYVISIFCLLVGALVVMGLFNAPLIVYIIPCLLLVFSFLSASAFKRQHTTVIRPAMKAHLIICMVIGSIGILREVWISRNAGGLFFALLWLGIYLQTYWSLDKRLFSVTAPSYKQLKYARNCKTNNIEMNIADFPDCRQSQKWTVAYCAFLWIHFALLAIGVLGMFCGLILSLKSC